MDDKDTDMDTVVQATYHNLAQMLRRANRCNRSVDVSFMPYTMLTLRDYTSRFQVKDKKTGVVIAVNLKDLRESLYECAKTYKPSSVVSRERGTIKRCASHAGLASHESLSQQQSEDPAKCKKRPRGAAPRDKQGHKMMWNSTIGRWESIYGSADGPTEYQYSELEDRDEAGGDASGDAGGEAGGDTGGEAGGEAGDDGASKREGKRVDRGLGEHDGKRALHLRIANTMDAAMREIERIDKIQATMRAEFCAELRKELDRDVDPRDPKADAMYRLHIKHARIKSNEQYPDSKRQTALKNAMASIVCAEAELESLLSDNDPVSAGSGMAVRSARHEAESSNAASASNTPSAIGGSAELPQ